jgi:radical SAM protein with 4Fe4S-binding SPASM domain
MRFSELPVLSEIAVTYRCNLRCAFCYAGCNCTTNPTGDGREMTAAEIRTVLERIYRDGKVPSVSFTGGEPTLRPELPELVRHAAELGLRVNLITNGTRVTAELAARLAEAGLASAQVSLEGVTARTHERITGIPGSHALTLAGVGHLRAAGIRVHTNTTLNRDNLHECERLPSFVRRALGLPRFSMNLVIPTGSAALNARLVVRYRELGPHLEAVQRAAAEEDVEFMWYSPTPMCLFNPIAHGLGNKGCSACDGLLSVAANGDVLPCSSYDDPVGNLLRDGVETVWRSRKARHYRDKGFAHPSCRGCENFPICHGACPLYWRRLGFGELPGPPGGPPPGKESRDS